MLASQLMDSESTPDAIIDSLFRRLTSRAPSDREQQILKRLFEQQQEAFSRQPEAARKYLSIGQSQRAARPAVVIPTNEHPLRFGVDGQGSSRFIGQLGRAHLIRQALSDEQIAELARLGPGGAASNGPVSSGDD